MEIWIIASLVMTLSLIVKKTSYSNPVLEFNPEIYTKNYAAQVDAIVAQRDERARADTIKLVAQQFGFSLEEAKQKLDRAEANPDKRILALKTKFEDPLYLQHSNMSKSQIKRQNEGFSLALKPHRYNYLSILNGEQSLFLDEEGDLGWRWPSS